MTDGRKPKTSRIRKARQLYPKKLSATEPSASPGAREDETPSDGGANQEFVDPFQRLIEEIGTRTELRTREFYLRGTNIRAVLLFLNELADSNMINCISMCVLRFGAMICAGVLFGVIFYFLILSIHLVKLKSFGVPYVAPVAPIYLSDWKDFVLRLPQKMMTMRPKMLFTQDEIHLRSPTRRK
ncbi:hypothetical protein GIJ05_08660 [Laceyella tengchongensis]|nr:hypothetical protein [Laceyella tengchongensis]